MSPGRGLPAEKWYQYHRHPPDQRFHPRARHPADEGKAAAVGNIASASAVASPFKSAYVAARTACWSDQEPSVEVARDGSTCNPASLVMKDRAVESLIVDQARRGHQRGRCDDHVSSPSQPQKFFHSTLSGLLLSLAATPAVGKRRGAPVDAAGRRLTGHPGPAVGVVS